MGSSNWTTPALEEVKMDAEIGSYQADEGLPVAWSIVRAAHRFGHWNIETIGESLAQLPASQPS